MEKSFKSGDIVLYENTGTKELGIVKRENNKGDGYFVYYSTGDTAANTRSEDIEKVENYEDHADAINFNIFAEMISTHLPD
ncbi:hypothetical protein [Enterococcus sp. AZ180]|uniref:hypothetical protein n=1 Tax=Enterococcus sp. AZ180 TaxID=2774961 RepID=UPI003F250947